MMIPLQPQVGEEFHADGMQVPRIIGIVYAADVLEENAALPRRRHSSQRQIRRRRQSYSRSLNRFLSFCRFNTKQTNSPGRVWKMDWNASRDAVHVVATQSNLLRTEQFGWEILRFILRLRQMSSNNRLLVFPTRKQQTNKQADCSLFTVHVPLLDSKQKRVNQFITIERIT